MFFDRIIMKTTVFFVLAPVLALLPDLGSPTMLRPKRFGPKKEKIRFSVERTLEIGGFDKRIIVGDPGEQEKEVARITSRGIPLECLASAACVAPHELQLQPGDVVMVCLEKTHGVDVYIFSQEVSS